MSRSSLVLILVVIALVNAPVLMSTWTRASVERNGEEVEATVVDTKDFGTSAEPQWWVSYTLPESVDPQQSTWAAQVDAAAYDAAEQAGSITVTALEDRPHSAIVEGEVRSRAGLVSTLVVDVLVLALLGLLWRVRVLRARSRDQAARPIRQPADDERQA